MKKKTANISTLFRAKGFSGIIKLFQEGNSEEKDVRNALKVHRIIALDILRGIAILLVLGRHVLDIPETLSPIVRHTFLIWREVGWIGVDLFFVLSGFLVSGLLFKEHRETGRLRVGLFLMRRAFKIYPSFYFLLLVSISTTYLYSFPVSFSGKSLLGEGLFLQNYLGSIWDHTWSLAVEEHFYLILSMVMIALVNLQPKTKEPFNFIPKLVLTLAIFILILRVWISQLHPIGEWGSILPYTHLRIDSLFFGVLISYYYTFKADFLMKKTRQWFWLCSTSVAVTLFLPLIFPLDQSRFMYSFGFSLLYLGFACLLLLCLHPACKCKIKVIRKFSWLAYIGRNSYSIYLWHMFSYNLAARVWIPTDSSPKLFFLRILAYLVGSLVMGVLIARTIEFPILRLRDRYFPSSRL